MSRAKSRDKKKEESFLFKTNLLNSWVKAFNIVKVVQFVNH